MPTDDLDDDCWYSVFDYIVTFEDHLIVSNVCKRWAFLISHQFNRLFLNTRIVKFALVKSETRPAIDTIYMKKFDFTKLDIHRLLPNIKVVEVNFNYFKALGPDVYKEIAKNNYAIKGVICDQGCYDLSMISCFPDAEMLVCTMLLHNRNCPFDISRLKQLYIRKGSLHMFAKYSATLFNLVRLHLNQDHHFAPYSGAILKNLKVLEYDLDIDRRDFTRQNDFDGFELMDHFPYLESAYLSHRTKNVTIDTSIVNTNLRDLVLLQRFENFHIDRFPYFEILKKFPNLKHLAIRNANDVDNGDVMQFVKILPKIELLDFKGSSNVTSFAAENLKKYSAESGRSIDIIFGPREEKKLVWEDINFREKVCLGFDFMRNCFFKSFEELPTIMLPEDC